VLQNAAAGTDTQARRNRPRVSRNVDPLVGRVNGNTITGRRIRQRWRAYLAALGNPTDPLVRAAAADAAELKIAAEDGRAALRAGKGDADQVVRMENAADRAERRLGLGARKREQPKGPTLRLRDYLAARAAAAPPADEGEGP
jgi:hypothetical protein